MHRAAVVGVRERREALGMRKIMHAGDAQGTDRKARGLGRASSYAKSPKKDLCYA